MGGFEKAAVRRFSDGLKRLWRTLGRLPLMDLFFVTIWPAYTVYIWSVTGWIWPWWMFVLAVALVGCALIDLCCELERATVTIDYPGHFRHKGQDYIVTTIVTSTDGTVRIEAITKAEYVDLHSSYRAAGGSRA